MTACFFALPEAALKMVRMARAVRLKMGFLAYNLLHLIRRFYLWGEDARRSIEWIITRLVKAGARIVYHARRWHVHVASAFPLGHYYRAVLGWQCWGSRHWKISCKDLVREVFSKRTKKLDSSRFWSGMMVFWAFPKQISTLKRENLTENWQMGMRNWFLGKVPHNSALIQIL